MPCSEQLGCRRQAPCYSACWNPDVCVRCSLVILCRRHGILHFAPADRSPLSMEVLFPPRRQKHFGFQATQRLLQDKNIYNGGKDDIESQRVQRQTMPLRLVVITSRGLVGICAPVILHASSHASDGSEDLESLTQRSFLELPRSRRFKSIRPFAAPEKQYWSRKCQLKAICISKHNFIEALTMQPFRRISC